jgi:hypothetical protein
LLEAVAVALLLAVVEAVAVCVLAQDFLLLLAQLTRLP